MKAENPEGEADENLQVNMFDMLELEEPPVTFGGTSDSPAASRRDGSAVPSKRTYSLEANHDDILFSVLLFFFDLNKI